MTFLLDVNVLIALMDAGHVSHDAAHAWFKREGHRDWATCPITENGVLRILGHPKYPNTPGSPAVVAEIVRRFRELAGHVFWPDAISLVNREHADAGEILTSRQVTDSYLLALAVFRGGRLATFDRRLSTKAVERSSQALYPIG